MVSLPTWERGLKREIHPRVSRRSASLPTWERGLKLSCSTEVSGRDKSLPTWERGLKLVAVSPRIRPASVAPHVGAWIETEDSSKLRTMEICRSPRGSVD